MDTAPHSSGALVSIATAVMVGLSLVGYLSGTARSDYDLEPPVTAVASQTTNVPRAVSYTELRHRPRGVGASGLADDLLALQARAPSVLDPVPLGGDKGPALSDRAALRSYDGAPPRIPHAVRQDSVPECLACHAEGLRFRGRLAPPVSHAAYTSCTQCHVVDEAPMPGGEALPADPRDVANSFVGLASPEAGPRAWSIAPPQIPHRTWMRERCESCHGVNGRSPLRSSHPDRQSCQQCHAPSADLDLRPGPR